MTRNLNREITRVIKIMSLIVEYLERGSHSMAYFTRQLTGTHCGT